jgi:hypothetical protein
VDSRATLLREVFRSECAERCRIKLAVVLRRGLLHDHDRRNRCAGREPDLKSRLHVLSPDSIQAHINR